MAFIEDGTGNGNEAKVNGNNQLSVFAESRTEFEQQVDRGRAFCVGSGVLSYAINNDSALFRMANTSANETVFIVDVITDRINLTTSAGGTAPLVRLLGGVTGFSGAETQLTLVNRKFGDSYAFPVEAFSADTVGQTFLSPSFPPLTTYVLPLSDVANNRATTFAAIPPGGSCGVDIVAVGGGTLTGGSIGVAFLGYIVDAQGAF